MTLISFRTLLALLLVVGNNQAKIDYINPQQGSGLKSRGNLAPKPLFRDPVFDGAADPVVIWNPIVKRWWMFYTNRRANAPGLSGVAWVHGTHIGIAESADGGATWTYVGIAAIVFRWRDSYWMITDVWRGLAVYASNDALNWTRQSGGNLLEQPGQGADDQVQGQHADVVVNGDRAFLFYFTHPGRRGGDEKKDGYEQRRSSIQVVELELKDGKITCDRDRTGHIRLSPPK